MRLQRIAPFLRVMRGRRTSHTINRHGHPRFGALMHAHCAAEFRDAQGQTCNGIWRHTQPSTLLILSSSALAASLSTAAHSDWNPRREPIHTVGTARRAKMAGPPPLTKKSNKACAHADGAMAQRNSE